MQEAVRNQYGPRKIGEREFAKQQAQKSLMARQATIYGKRKGGGGAPKPIALTHSDPERPRSEANQPEKSPFLKENGDRVTLGAMEMLLEKDPSLLDLAIEAEFSHKDEPRKGGVEILLRLEGQRPGGPRESVTKLLGQVS